MSSRFVLALAISAGMALLVTGIFYQIAVRDNGAPRQDVATTEVVVAVRDLDIGARIEASDLRLDDWPASKFPAWRLPRL
jgi:Flp pilus assembly protein CpaB